MNLHMLTNLLVLILLYILILAVADVCIYRCIYIYMYMLYTISPYVQTCTSMYACANVCMHAGTHVCRQQCRVVVFQGTAWGILCVEASHLLSACLAAFVRVPGRQDKR